MRVLLLLVGLYLGTATGCAHERPAILPQRGVPPEAALPQLPVKAPHVEEPWRHASTLFRGLNDRRRARGIARLHIDSTLSLVAERALQQYLSAGRGAEQQAASVATSELRSQSLVFRSIVAQVLVVGQLTDFFSASTAAFDPKLESVGMAIAERRSSDGDGFCLVVILGEQVSPPWYAFQP